MIPEQNRKVTIIILIGVMMISLVSPTDFAYNNLDLPTLSKTVINYTTVNVNSSEFWDNLDTPLDFSDGAFSNKLSVGTTDNTAAMTVHGTGFIQEWYNEDAAANSRMYRLNGGSGSLALSARNDNGNYKRALMSWSSSTGDITSENNHMFNGNIAKGTSAPQREVHLHNGDPAILFTDSTTGATANDGTTLQMYNQDFYINNREAKAIFMRTAGVDALTIDSSRRIGINDATPLSNTRLTIRDTAAGTRDRAISFGYSDTYHWTIGRDTTSGHGYLQFISEENDVITTPMKIYPNGTTIITGDLSVGKNFSGNQYYGEMYFHNDTQGNISIVPSADVWYNVTSFGQEMNGNTLNGFSLNGDSVSLNTNIAGLYRIDYHITMTGQANNKYHYVVGVDSSPQLNTESHLRMSGPADVVSTSGSGFVRLTNGDDVSLMILNEDGGNDATIFSSNLNLVRIGD